MAVVVVPPAAVEDDVEGAVGQLPAQQHLRVALGAQLGVVQVIAVVAALRQFEAGVPVVAQVACQLERRALEDESAIVLPVPAQLQALRRAFQLLHALPQQLFLDRRRLPAAHRGEAFPQRLVAMPEALQGLDPLGRVQPAGRQQAFEGDAVVVAQGLLDRFGIVDLQPAGAPPGQPVVAQRLLVAGVETFEEAVEPELQHRRLAVPGLPRQPLGHQRPLADRNQMQVAGETVRRGIDPFLAGLAQQDAAQAQGAVLVTGGVQRIGIGGLHQPVVGVGLQVAVEPGQRLVIAVEHQVGAGERQPQFALAQRPGAPVLQQRRQRIALPAVDVEPEQPFANPAFRREALQGLQVDRLGLRGVAVFLGETGQRHLVGRHVDGSRLRLALRQQAAQRRPVAQVLGQFQGRGQTLEIGPALQAGDQHRQGLARLGPLVEGDQLFLFAGGQRYSQGQHALVGLAGIVVVLQDPGDLRAQLPVVGPGHRALVHAGEHVPGGLRVELAELELRPFDALVQAQRETPGHVRPDPARLRQLLHVPEQLVQALPGQALPRVARQVVAQPGFARLGRAARLVAVDHGVELLVAHLPLAGHRRQQVQHRIEVEQLRGEAPGMLVHLRRPALAERPDPELQGLPRMAGPLAQARHAGQQRGILGTQGEQFLADLPGPVGRPGSHAQLEIRLHRRRIARVQFPPALDEAFRQVEALAALGGAHAFLQPELRVGIVAQLLQVRGQQFGGLLRPVVRQQAGERLVQVLVAPQRVVRLRGDLLVELGRAFRLVRREMPVGRPGQPVPALLRIPPGQFFIGGGGLVRRLQLQRRGSQPFELRVVEGGAIDLPQPLDQRLLGLRIQPIRIGLRLQQVQLEAVERLDGAAMPAQQRQMLACALMFAERDQLADQAQAQGVVVRVEPEQDFGVVDRDGIRPVALPREKHVFAVEQQHQQKQHPRGDRQDRPGTQQASLRARFNCRQADHRLPAPSATRNSTGHSRPAPRRSFRKRSPGRPKPNAR
ncbi:hypothetical protein D9M71_105510 [compost metagenome]